MWTKTKDNYSLCFFISLCHFILIELFSHFFSSMNLILYCRSCNWCGKVLGDVSVGSSSNLRKSRYERIQKRKKENKKHGTVGLDSSSSSSHLGIHERNFLTEGFSQANDDNQPIQGLVIRFYKFSPFFFLFFFLNIKFPITLYVPCNVYLEILAFPYFSFRVFKL